MVRRMLGGMSAYALANEVSVSQPVLLRWRRLLFLWGRPAP
ncbi:hypothetical protein EBU99_14595 [bacterium]|nr:hypothetical protein [bacterium]